MILFFESETSDLIRTDVALTDPQQPWAVAIAAELCDDDSNRIAGVDTLIRAEGRRIAKKAEARHRISVKASEKVGILEVRAMATLAGLAGKATHIIGYDMEFSRDVILGVLKRGGKKPTLWTRPGLEFVSLIKPCSLMCGLPPTEETGEPKLPTRNEACRIMLDEEPVPDVPEGAAVAAAMARLIAKVGQAKRLYRHLVERGALESVGDDPLDRRT